MSIAKITMLGFESWLNNESKSLFDHIKLPEGVDKDVLVGNILLQGGEFEVLFSNPYSMRKYIELWSEKYQRTFKKWVDGLAAEYNPIDNYDRYEEWEDITEGHGVNKNESSTDSNSIFDNKVTAYDSDQLHEKAQDTSKDTAVGKSTNDITSTGKATHKAHIHGNIGVTTSSAMLSEFLDMQKWNIYEHITDLFLQEFTIMVYE